MWTHFGFALEFSADLNALLERRRSLINVFRIDNLVVRIDPGLNLIVQNQLHDLLLNLKFVKSNVTVWTSSLENYWGTELTRMDIALTCCTDVLNADAIRFISALM